MSRPLRVLHIEDSIDDAALIERQLRRGGFLPEVYRTDCIEAARAALLAESWDIILCDYALPGFNAQDVFTLLREHNIDIPFIIISGTIGEERAVECMRAGVRDFILKDRLGRLPHAVERELADVTRRAEEKRMHEKLRQAEEALVRSDKLRALGQMAAGISHDLKNLLNPLYMRIDLLNRQVRRADAEAAQRSLEEMRSILQMGVQTIERLHAFSRQAPESRSESIEVNRIAHEAMEIARPRMAQSRNIPCFLQEAFGMPPSITGNRSEILSALVNLVVNAIDAMPEGGTVTMLTNAEQGGTRIQVIDDGPGMAPDVEKRIFEPFFTTKGEAGMGLGLAMVYSTVMRHAGTISVATERGKGTTFSLWFPAPG